MGKKPLGASFWQSLDAASGRELSEELRAIIACPDDVAPLDWVDQTGEFRCPACGRVARETDGVLSLLPTSDAYRAKHEYLAMSAERAAASAATQDDPAMVHGELWHTALALAGNLSKAHVLDLACGTAGPARAFVAAGARHVVAVDVVPGAGGLATARERKLPGSPLDLVQGDVARLPFLAGSFDIVYMGGALHQHPNPGRFMVEVARVMAPEGLVLNLGEPMASHRTVGLAGGDPRARGRTLTLADYEAMYREGDLALVPLFPGPLPTPARGPAGWLGRIRSHWRHHHSTAPRLFVGRRVGGMEPVTALFDYLENRKLADEEETR